MERTLYTASRLIKEGTQNFKKKIRGEGRNSGNFPVSDRLKKPLATFNRHWLWLQLAPSENLVKGKKDKFCCRRVTFRGSPFNRKKKLPPGNVDMRFDV